MKFLIIAFIATTLLVQENGAIKGGQNMTAGEFPFLVSIWARDFGLDSFACAGTLIEPDVVMTVASCLFNTEGQLYNTSTVTVRAGGHILERRQPEEQSRGLLRMKAHDRFFLTRLGEADEFKINDIALLFLSEPFNLTETVQLATLPTESFDETEGLVLGWGFYDEDRFASYLPPKKLQLRVADDVACINKYRNNGFNQNYQFCAGVANQGICRNDYGGPFLVGENNDIFAGVISFMIPQGRDCVDDTVGNPITRVDTYNGWIFEQIGREPPTPPTTEESETSDDPDPTEEVPSSSVNPGDNTTAGGIMLKTQSMVICLALLVGVWLRP